MFSSFFSIHQLPRVCATVCVCVCDVFSTVFENGSTCDVANYRPISLTCVACMFMMERLVTTRFLDYLHMRKLIISYRAIQPSLICLQFVNDWTLAMNNGQSVMVAL